MHCSTAFVHNTNIIKRNVCENTILDFSKPERNSVQLTTEQKYKNENRTKKKFAIIYEP